MRLRAPLSLAAALALTACGNNMVQQARYDEYESAPLFPDRMVMQHPPDGTLSRDAPARAAAAERPPMTLALVERGRERYRIFCAPCHGLDGSGDGIVPARGFPHPPSFHSERLRAAPSAHFYEVITEGYGAMYSYADRVPPPDRWAIAAYVRALQATRLDPRAADREEAGDGA